MDQAARPSNRDLLSRQGEREREREREREKRGRALGGTQNTGMSLGFAVDVEIIAGVAWSGRVESS